MRYLVLLLVLTVPAAAQDIPLPEHPRPIFERPQWQNLNGEWDFRFDPNDEGIARGWFENISDFDRSIIVPFPWGAPLSGVEDEADIGWYARMIDAPDDWEGQRVFLVVGAADWHTTVWLDGQQLGEHQGGYTPFEFELTPHLRADTTQTLVLRVDDTEHAFKLEGKQGYGPARGIWQTPYLEARGDAALDVLHFTPDIDAETVTVEARLLEPAPADLTLNLDFITGDVASVQQTIAEGEDSVRFEVPIPEPRLWRLEDPFLYEVEAELSGADGAADQVQTYFGMRKVSVVDLPGTDYPYVALNNEPVYIEMALDQAYHPEGYYTFPSDEFIRDEVLRSRQIGLNGMRVHVKIGHPRKLYWADRLGVIIMADVPNSWGEPDEEMRSEVEYALRQMIKRDYNHPSILFWIPFNETWGLRTEVEENGEPRDVYLQETKDWVVSIVELTRELDPTRLVEDNSICCGVGHTVTDLHTWHAYLPGWEWDEFLQMASDSTYPGSSWNFEPGYVQGRQPNLNSEFGNVWGYEGSTGDVDWSWDYHRALNAFRRYPKIAGWLYTEHHDVINEWNGYWKYDRSEKETGLSELVPGMSVADFHTPLYISTGGDLSEAVEAGSTVEVPLWASFLTSSEAYGDSLRLHVRVEFWDELGRKHTGYTGLRNIAYRPWRAEALDPLAVPMPDQPGLALVILELADVAGTVHHRNFTTFVVEGDASETLTLENGATARLVSFDPAGFAEAEWSLKQWNVLDGLKVNGAGAGHFTYRVPWPEDLERAEVQAAALVLEASAKQLFGKDREQEGIEGDYMRGGGTFDNSLNPNAYPMTDGTKFSSAVTIYVNGERSGHHELSDDPADHRGILSWHSQMRDRRLREAGSYGERMSITLPPDALDQAAEAGELVIRLEVDDALPGGLALYGSRFGRYPLDPTLVFTLQHP